ncbi:MAG: 30S ribosomal protein S18 [Anaerolineae bacterium]|nr:30S ribosomal protein S18 [Anaerolineae bacterium]
MRSLASVRRSSRSSQREVRSLARQTRSRDQDDGGQRRFSRRQKTCFFCEEKILSIDYKRSDLLWRFLTDRGKIRPRRQTGTCAKHQRQLSLAVKRARHLALLPFVAEPKRPR